MQQRRCVIEDHLECVLAPEERSSRDALEVDHVSGMVKRLDLVWLRTRVNTEGINAGTYTLPIPTYIRSAYVWSAVACTPQL